MGSKLSLILSSISSIKGIANSTNLISRYPPKKINICQPSIWSKTELTFSRLPCYVFCICLLTYIEIDIRIQISWVGRSTNSPSILGAPSWAPPPLRSSSLSFGCTRRNPPPGTSRWAPGCSSPVFVEFVDLFNFFWFWIFFQNFISKNYPDVVLFQYVLEEIFSEVWDKLYVEKVFLHIFLKQTI